MKRELVVRRTGGAAGRRVGLGVAFALLACVAVLGQQAQRFAQAQQENARQLRQYSWQSRREIRKGGETKSVQLYSVRHDVDGTPQQTQIGGTPPQQIPTHGLRGLMAKKKKEDFIELLEGLGALAKAYGELAPDKLQRFMAGATVTPEMDARQSLVRIEGGGVLQPGDVMTVWVDAATRRQRRVEILTTYDRKPVRIVSEFQDLPGGPSYTARAVVDYPSQELVITTDNFGHARD
ncbi:MAG TPA: hypothetical protein VF546_02285 [Pyrinomonadaceae bacterium]|jgi:hypothetical protein